LNSSQKSDKQFIALTIKQQQVSPMVTHLFTHRDCLFHDTGYEHPEKSDRLRMVWQYLEEDEFEAIVRHDASMGTTDLLELAHTPDHIDYIKSKRPDSGIVQLDPDTFMSPGSYDAAMRGVGAARDAVDLVMTQPGTNAFCAIRPPGHHAEADRAMGFCLFNNVAIAAKYAQQKYGITRIAVVDFDVHHGNGTQAIFEDEATLFYGSTHQEAPFYPGTGHRHETGAGNIFNSPLPEGSGGAEFKIAMERDILPALVAFDPELLIISAGFDAHHQDPRAGLNWTEEDYIWISNKLIKIAEQSCSGRVISVLEGGYDLVGLAQSAAVHVKALLDA